MSQKLYTYEEYGELIDQEGRAFYVECRLAAHKAQAEDMALSLDEWDQMFDDFVAELRAQRSEVRNRDSEPCEERQRAERGL